MKKITICILCGILLLAAFLSACTKEDHVYLEQEEETYETTEAEKPDRSKEPAFCCVYVCGAVVNAGVYRLPDTARVCDALEAAGGFTEDAARESVNLAEPIYDAQQIRIPTEAEISDSDFLAEDSASLPATSADAAADGRVNLNRATQEELMTLPGIGASKAQDILDYRTQNGFFASVEEIMNVTGIKEGTFEKIKDSITVN